jgi:hypothetical protein
LQTVHTSAALNRVFMIEYGFHCLLNHVMHLTKCWKTPARSQRNPLQSKQIMCNFRSGICNNGFGRVDPPACHSHIHNTCSFISHLSCPRAGRTHNLSSTTHGHMSSLHKRAESCAAIIIRRNRILAREK